MVWTASNSLGCRPLNPSSSWYLGPCGRQHSKRAQGQQPLVWWDQLDTATYAVQASTRGCSCFWPVCVYLTCSGLALLQVPELSDMLQLDEYTCAELLKTVLDKVSRTPTLCVAAQCRCCEAGRRRKGGISP